MKILAAAALSALLLTGLGAATATPAQAASFGFYIGDGYHGPRDYHRYRTWHEPVYYGGSWYRGPIYYRTYGSRRMYWLDGGWRYDGWRGPRPRHIEWRDRGWRGRDHWRHDRRHWR